jgi:two-component system response regulator FixJ
VHCEYLRIGYQGHCSENYVHACCGSDVSEEALVKENASVVVVVDDDPEARASLRLRLKSLGLAAVTYGSAAAFLAAFDPEQPGCLLLDIRMPITSGLELQQQLQERGNVAPVIFLTGHGDVTMAVEAMRLGAYDFLQKPFRDRDLLDRVPKALAKDRAQRLL